MSFGKIALFRYILLNSSDKIVESTLLEKLGRISLYCTVNVTDDAIAKLYVT